MSISRNVAAMHHRIACHTSIVQARHHGKYRHHFYSRGARRRHNIKFRVLRFNTTCFRASIARSARDAQRGDAERSDVKGREGMCGPKGRHTKVSESMRGTNGLHATRDR